MNNIFTAEANLEVTDADRGIVIDMLAYDMQGEAVRFIQKTYKISQEEAICVVDKIDEDFHK